jgi:hypothetical protein
MNERESMVSAVELFEQSLKWLEETYPQRKYFTERDIVWTIQTYIQEEITKNKLPFRVLCEWPIESGKRKSLCADLVIMNGSSIEIAAEFKYEPSHERKGDFSENKLKQTVVFWDKEGVGEDVERVKKFVEDKKTKIACSVFIDEGKRFQKRDAFAGSQWQDWKNSDVRVLISWAGRDNLKKL